VTLWHIICWYVSYKLKSFKDKKLIETIVNYFPSNTINALDPSKNNQTTLSLSPITRPVMISLGRNNTIKTLSNALYIKCSWYLIWMFRNRFITVFILLLLLLLFYTYRSCPFDISQTDRRILYRWFPRPWLIRIFPLHVQLYYSRSCIVLSSCRLSKRSQKSYWGIVLACHSVVGVNATS